MLKVVLILTTIHMPVIIKIIVHNIIIINKDLLNKIINLSKNNNIL